MTNLFASRTVATCFMLTAAANLFAQTQPAEALRNVAQLSTSGSVEVQQDLLFVTLNTSRDGPDAAAVQTQLKQALDAALNIAKQSVSPGQLDVKTGNFSLYPRYSKDGKINGWQGSTELLLEGRDFLKVTSTVGKIQTLTLGNISFGLSREQRAKVESEAQSQAIERFKGRALEISKAFGFTTYSLREVSINANEQGNMPRPRAMSMARSDLAEAAVPVEAGKSTVLVNISGSVLMQ